MSGGHYNYEQHCINNIIDVITDDLDFNVGDDPAEWYPDMPNDVIIRMKELKQKLELVAKLVHEADWLYSGDTGPETFCIQYDKIIRGEL